MTEPARAGSGRLFEGPTEMHARCAAHDWSQTPLGPSASWPQSLKTATGITLGSGFAEIVLWGQDLVQIYNDAYIPFLGVKHPWGLGIPTRVCWPEAWDFNQPIYERVLGGETVSFEDQLYRLKRRGPNAPPDDVYITLSYKPIPAEGGRISGVLVTAIDTTAQVTARRLQIEREKLIAELDVERRRLSEAFEQAPAFIAVLRGPDHVFELTNPQYQRLIGHRDVIGQPVRDALPEVEDQGFLELLDQVYESGEAFVGTEVPVRLEREGTGDLETVFLNFVYQPLRLADGVDGIIAHGVDVTSQVRARQAIEEANQAKAGFLATMSHELRTPLNAMIGYSSLLLEGIPEPLSEPVAARVRRIELSAQHLLELIEEVLTFSRIDAGREHVSIESIDLRRLLDEAVAIAEPLAAEKGLSFRVHPPDDPVLVETDSRKIRQILINLIGNAIKFTAEGEVSVRLEAEPDHAVFTVTDTGAGIAPEHLDTVFEPFFQVDSEPSRRHSGTGLGLSVSQKLARLLGGDVTVESRVGEGSTFRLLIPREPPPQTDGTGADTD